MTPPALRCFAAVALLASGCGDDASTPAGDGGLPDAGPATDGAAAPTDAAGGSDAGACVERWVVESVGGEDAMTTVEGGALVLAARNVAPGVVPISVYQAGLAGDFEGAFVFDRFDPSAPGAYLEAFVGTGPGEQAAGGISSVAPAGLGVSVEHAGAMPASMATPSTGTSGYVRFKRTGDSMEVTAGAGADMAMVTGVLPGDGLRIGIRIGNGGTDTVGGVTTVRITDFVLTGGGAEVTGDSFDCPSLRP